MVMPGINIIKGNSVMTYCIIAIKEKNQYTSIVCHSKQRSNIGDVLRNYYTTTDAVRKLLTMGDLNRLEKDAVISFHFHWGYRWNEARPIDHSHHSLLMAYSSAIGAESLYVFENNQWHEKEIQFQDQRAIA